MSATRGKYTKILVDEFDFSGDSNQLDIDTSTGSLDATTFADTAKVMIADSPELTFQHNGFFGGIGAGEFEQELQERIGGAGAYVTALIGTDTAACPAYWLPLSTKSQFKIGNPVGGLSTIQAQWLTGPGGARRGLRILDATLSATGAQTGRDFGAAGSAGGYAILHVTAITGSATNATIKVQSDSDVGFGSAADEGTFTFSAVGAYVITLSGAIGRYIRADLTSLGGATNVTVVIAVAVEGVTM